MDMGLTDKQLDKLYGRDVPPDEQFEIYILRNWYPMDTNGWNYWVKRIEQFWEQDEDVQKLILLWTQTQRIYQPSLIERIKQILTKTN